MLESHRMSQVMSSGCGTLRIADSRCSLSKRGYYAVRLTRANMGDPVPPQPCQQAARAVTRVNDMTTDVPR